jgi:nucleoside-diphosphate-sugar epimerase
LEKQKEAVKRALLTGSAGFTGSYVLRALLQAGWQVDILIRPTSELGMIKDITSKVGVHIYNGTLDDAMHIVSTTSPDLVIHLASMVVGEHKPEEVTALIESNILLGTQLLESMAKVGIKYFVNTGTYWEHFQGGEYSPVGLYAASKFAFQNILQYYVELKGINSVTLKLYDAYGMNDPRAKLMNLLVRAAETDELILMTEGNQKIDLIHVLDVAEAYISAARRLLNGLVRGHEIYGVGTGNHLTVREVVAMVESICGKKLNIEWGKRPYREREVMVPCRLESLPGWRPRIELEKGIAMLFQAREIDNGRV